MTQPDRDPQIRVLEKHFRRKPIATLAELERALGTSARTVFRALSRVGYLTSYSHAGRYYTLSRLPAFDADGLWFHGEICFSRHHTLRATVVVLVKDSPAGYTHEELQALLRLRVHDTLRSLVSDKALARELLTGVYVYLHPDGDVASAQMARRRQRAAPTAMPVPSPAAPLDLARVVDVLIAVIHAPKDDSRAIATRLWACGVEVTSAQVEDVFAAYGLEKKTAHARSRSRRLRR
jgi:hypothetical protein